MSATITVRELEPADFPAWERFVADSPDGSIYSLPRYLDVLCAATGASFAILAAYRAGEILAGVALFERKSVVGTYVAPRLLLYYNGFVLGRSTSKYPSEQTSLHLRVMDCLEDAIRVRRPAAITLRSRHTLEDVRPLLARGWTATPSYSYVVDMTDPEAAWNRVEGNFRRLVRRCEKQGFRLVTDEDFDSFHRLHEEIHERKGIDLYLPKERFRKYYQQLAEASLARLYHARLPDGTAAASQLVLLGPHPVTHSVCAGASGEHIDSGASVFLRWKVCEALAAEGYSANDLTDAALNAVTRFKSQFGADLRMSLVVKRPPTAAWRLWSAVGSAADFFRRGKRFALRRLRRTGMR